MIYKTPQSNLLAKRLAHLDKLRARLRRGSATPKLWLGTLRRLAQASAVASSVAIEGYAVDEEEARAIVDGESAPAAGQEDQLAVAAYAHAFDHIGVLAADPVFAWSDRVILDLHFDACSFQRDRSPGLWRSGPVYVTRPGGGVAYEAPPASEVVPLMAEVVDWLERGDVESHVVVRAAMAHLHCVSVHPFRDGNGRIARLVQSLVLARDGLLAPELSSIEDYLADHTPAYYAVLEEVQGGRYSPQRDAAPWVRFCIEAHIAQAERRLEQMAEAAIRWGVLEGVVEERGWPDRLVVALEQSLIGGSDRARYERETGVSSGTASNDFRRLVDAGLVLQRGRGPATSYVATDELRARVNAALAEDRR